MSLVTNIDAQWLNALSRDTRTVLSGAVENYLKQDQLQDYRAYPKQAIFHAAGKYFRNRLIKAGNQQGKTHSVGAECAMHLTGEYPDWWTGKRFDRPIVMWASGETAESTRDNPQRVLLGRPREVGTGLIPKRCLSGIYGRSRAAADAYEFYMIRHKSGGLSMLKFRYYAQEREAWQGPPVDVVLFDEEPPWNIYQEGLARTIAVQGITLMSFTPLKGYSEVVNLYVKDPEPEKSGRYVMTMTIHDAKHLTEEEKQAEIARWPVHEQRARIYGEPALGEGMIYPFDRSELVIEPFDLPDHFTRLAALDFGGATGTAHPTGAVLMAHDPENDVLYVTREYREVARLPAEHWLRLRYWENGNVKWAWPRDGLMSEKSTGTQAIEMYRSEGMRTLPQYAQYPGTTRKRRGQSGHAPMQSVLSVERGILDIHNRMKEGRFKVFSTCNLWFEEQRTYHRKRLPSGKMEIVKSQDDLMDATRYGVMMLRYFTTMKPKSYEARDVPMWELGV